MNPNEVLDLKENPFILKSWVVQGFGLTKYRKNQLVKILYKTIDEISVLPRNEGKYIGFISIRWGFAKIAEGNLLPTIKWDNRQMFDKYGH